MLGRTHLIFGTCSTLAAIVVTGIGIPGSIERQRVSFTLAGSLHTPSWPVLEPSAWVALAVAAAIGSLLPDIDQPGSLLTRLPEREARDLRHAGARYVPGPVAASPMRITIEAIGVAGSLASAMLGSNAGPSRGYRLVLGFLAALAALVAIMFRWLPPRAALHWSVADRHTAALVFTCLAGAAGLLAAGGVAGIVNRLPGHHRGWTHAPPIGLGLTVAAIIFGPVLFPALPGVGAAFGIGYVTHLAADALTIKGIPVWLPGRNRPALHLLPPHVRVRTGSAGETVFNLVWPPSLVVLVIVLGH